MGRYINYPDHINDGYDLVAYELGGFEPCCDCGRVAVGLVEVDGSPGIGCYCFNCGNAVAGPVNGREVKGRVPPVKHGTYEFPEIRAARRWNNAMHWVADGRPGSGEEYKWMDGVRRGQA